MVLGDDGKEKEEEEIEEEEGENCVKNTFDHHNLNHASLHDDPYKDDDKKTIISCSMQHGLKTEHGMGYTTRGDRRTIPHLWLMKTENRKENRVVISFLRLCRQEYGGGKSKKDFKTR